MTRPSTFTAEQDKQIRHDHANGMTTTSMAVKYQRARSTVRRQLVKLGLQYNSRYKHHEWTPKQDDKLRILWADETIPKANIAFEMSMGNNLVMERAQFLKLPKRKVNHATKVKPLKIEITPWPEDMPDFEDHSSIKQGSGANARRAAGRYG